MITSKKNIFITGGTTGIGLFLAKLYATEGHRVGICGRDLKKLPINFKKDNPNIESYEVDVTDVEKLNTSINDFAKGKLDIIIANAGIGLADKTNTPNFQNAKKVMNVNVIGVLNTFEAGLKLMLHKRQGHLVAISSVAGMVGLPGAGAYSASKAAVLKLCESLAIDLKKHGIVVTAIAPGFIDTPLTQQNNHPMPFIMDVEKGARIIKYAIDRKKYLLIFPLPMSIVMFILEKMPRSLYRLIMNFRWPGLKN